MGNSQKNTNNDNFYTKPIYYNNKPKNPKTIKEPVKNLRLLMGNYHIDMNELEKYLDKLEDINTIYPNNSIPFYTYCERSNLEMKVFKTLLEKANLDVIDKNQRFRQNALHFLLKNKNLKIEHLKFIFEEHKDKLGDNTLLSMKDKSGKTPFYSLIQNPTVNIELVEYLINKKASAKDRAKKGKTLITVALNLGLDVKILQKLIEEGADIETKARNGDSLLNICFRNSKCKSEYIDLFLDKSIDTNTQNKLGETALMIAVSNQRTTKTRLAYLLSSGVDLDLVNSNGHTAKQICIDKHRKQFLEMIREAEENRVWDPKIHKNLSSKFKLQTYYLVLCNYVTRMNKKNIFFPRPILYMVINFTCLK
eukprot:TRINITY_DN17247_c0_g1_i1.p1 TRINITY_DN17247_c0_g1~~TRINITY_DN17247_c0_g1_i1.p1  ORF type:complete len:365 (-),score=73.53 TRINITY_DN17247_c0_g1_i1:71-1165(-)